MAKIQLMGTALVAAALVAGCGQNQTEVADNGEAMIVVNGKTLTRKAIDADVEKIIAFQGNKIPTNQLEYARRMFANQVAQSFLIENVLAAKAAELGYLVTDEDIKEREAEFLKQTAGMPDAPKSLEEAAAKSPLGKERALAEMKAGILIDKMLKAEAIAKDSKDYSAQAKAIIAGVISNNAAASSQYVIRSMTSLTGCDIYGAMFDAPGAMMNCIVRAGGFGATLAPGENAYATGTFGVSHSSPLVANSQSQAINATNCLFTGCQVSSMIAGSNARRRHMSLVNCTFAGNQANCTFDNMRADTDDTKGELEIVNSLFAENLTSAGTESRDFRPDSAANDTSVTIRNCLIPGGLPAGWTPRETGVIVTGSPRFCKDHDLANPYALRYASPARAAGLVQDWMSAATDVRCNADFARLRDDKVDIGCYQCWLDPVGSMLLIR